MQQRTSEMSQLSIRPIRSVDGLAAVRAFRYQVCVQQQGLSHFEGTDHEAGTIGDHLDHDFAIFGAFAGSQLVGTVRWGMLNWTKRPQRHTCLLAALGYRDPTVLSVIDRLVVAPNHRHLSSLRAIAQAVGTYALYSGTKHNFCWANRKLTRLYERLGFEDTGIRVENAAGETLNILQLDLHTPSRTSPLPSPLGGSWNLPSFTRHAA